MFGNLDKEDRPAKPWDIFNKKIGRVSNEVAETRYKICINCPKIVPVTRQCLECGCFMKIKTTLPNAECPLGKWGKEQKTDEW
jgi:hypothetical protein